MSVLDLVSVIIPVHNAATYLRDAIDSVTNQTHNHVEIIVVDDASNDGTAAVAAGYRDAVRYAWQTRRGPAAARNHGVRISAGRYVAFLDADDLWEPGKLEAQLAAFDADPTLDVVFGHVVQFSTLETATTGEPLRGDHPGTMLVPRAVFDEVGPFCEDHTVGDFIDWYARALDRGLNMLMLELVVMRRRLHATNLGRVTPAVPGEYARVLREVVERRRGRER